MVVLLMVGLSFCVRGLIGMIFCAGGFGSSWW